MLVATFSGNVPDFDLLAATEAGATTPVQVKALCKGHWQFTIRKFVELRMEGKKQILGKRVIPKIPNLPCVFVLAPKSESDKARFFILEWEQLQDIVISKYQHYLDRNNGVRPRKYDSPHTAVSVDQLVEAKCENNWALIRRRATK